MSDATVAGPNLEQGLKTPVEVAKLWNGGAVSTPLLFGDTLVSAGYDQRVHLYDLDVHAGRRRATPARCRAPTATAATGA